MATFKKNYKDIDDTMRHIRLQVEESLPFARRFIGRCKDPNDLYFKLKPYLKYRKDPPGVELLQSLPTLIKNNFYGASGSGDCDCFTIAAVACCLVQRWPGAEIWIKLAGRNKAYPVHIWSGVTYKGKEYPMDLTNRIPGYERRYPYVQTLRVSPKVINTK
jgi:hypothetical protein